jgi:transcriptional regulator with XRE-family HTH domain
MEHFKERLRLLRKKRGFTTEQLSKKVGIARSSYAGYETGHRFPSLEALKKLATSLDTSTDFLMGITENPLQKEPNRNIKTLLTENGLHWDGIPLAEEDLKQITNLLEYISKHIPAKECDDHNKEEKINAQK